MAGLFKAWMFRAWMFRAGTLAGAGLPDTRAVYGEITITPAIKGRVRVAPKQR